MRIAVYHNMTSGGGKRTLYEALRRLAKQHRVDVYALSTADESFCDVRPLVSAYYVVPFTPSRLCGSPFGRLNHLQRWRDLHRLDRLMRTIAAEIDDRGYDAVFVQLCMWTQAPLLLRYLESPTIYYCHEPPREIYEPLPRVESGPIRWRTGLDHLDPLLRLYRSTVRRLDWEATRAASVVLVNSRFMCGAVGDIYKVTPILCYHGVDVDVFWPDRDVQQQDYVISVGAIQPRKGFDFLIESLGTLPEAERPSLRLVGNAELPGYSAELRRLAVLNGIKLDIEINISQDALVRRYNAALLMAYAPLAEPFGLAPLEAMACGRPVVGVAEGGVRESVTNGLSGLLVERDPAQFAAAVQALLRDPQRRETLGRQAREDVVQRWSWEASVSRLNQVFQAAAAGAAQGIAAATLCGAGAR